MENFSTYGIQSNNLIILTKIQKENFYSLPTFSNQQQDYYFDLNQEELKVFNKFRTIDTKIHFILLLGYFKFGKMFYDFSFLNLKSDIQYILNKYFNSQDIRLKKGISKNIKTIQRNEVLKLTGYKRINEEIKNDLNQILKEQISIDSNPLFIFDKLVLFCENNSIIIPEYTIIQRIIGNIIFNYEKKIFDKLDKILDDNIKEKIEKLLFDEIKNQKILTSLKTSSKGFNTSEIESELEKKNYLEELYLISIEVIKKLNLQTATIKYLYNVVLKYKVDKIASWRNFNQKNLYILCFINYRFENFNDNLVITFQSLVGKYRNLIIKEAQDKINAETKEIFKDIAKFDKILSYLDDKTDFDEDLFKVAKEKFFKKMLPKENFSKIRKQIVKVHNRDYKYQWENYDSKYPTIRRNLRPLIKNLDFSFSKELIQKNEFKRTLEYFQSHIRKNNNKVNWTKISISWVPKSDLKYLYNNNKLLENRLEIYIYNTLKKYIKSNEIFFENSLNFKSFESDLILINEYFENKIEYHKKLDLKYLNEPLKEILKKKVEFLRNLFLDVNQNILEGKNSAFKQKNNERWHLKYFPKNDKFEDNLFSNIPMKHLIEIMIKVQKETNFLSGLKHIAKKGYKRDISKELLIASIFTCGTNIGPYNMEQILVHIIWNNHLILVMSN